MSKSKIKSDIKADARTLDDALQGIYVPKYSAPVALMLVKLMFDVFSEKRRMEIICGYPSDNSDKLLAKAKQFLERDDIAGPVEMIMQTIIETK